MGKRKTVGQVIKEKKIDWNKLWEDLPDNLAGDPHSFGYSRTREEVQQLKFVLVRLVEEINSRLNEIYKKLI